MREKGRGGMFNPAVSSAAPAMPAPRRLAPSVLDMAMRAAVPPSAAPATPALKSGGTCRFSAARTPSRPITWVRPCRRYAPRSAGPQCLHPGPRGYGGAASPGLGDWQRRAVSRMETLIPGQCAWPGYMSQSRRLGSESMPDLILLTLSGLSHLVSVSWQRGNAAVIGCLT